jgi:hypothetical protein
MSFHTLRYDLKETYKNNVSKAGINKTAFLKGVASSFTNFGDRITNSNHRHDEPHEQAADAAREAEKDQHRFRYE